MSKLNVITYNRDYDKQMLLLSRNYPMAYAILFLLINKMDNSNYVLLTGKEIQEDINISQSTVARGIKLLKEHSFIDIQKLGVNNVYHINPDIAVLGNWKQ